MKEQLDIRNERVVKQRVDYDELLADINAVLDDLPEKVQAKLRADFSEKRKQRKQVEEKRETSVQETPNTVAEFARKYKRPDRNKGRGRDR